LAIGLFHTAIINILLPGIKMIFTEFHCKIDYDFCMIWMWLILLIILNTFWLGLVLVGPPENRLMILPALLFAW